MKKFVKVIALSAIIGSTCFSAYNLKSNKTTIYANEPTVTSTEVTEAITEAEDIDLSPKAREYTLDELSDKYKTFSTITLSDNASKTNSDSVSIDKNTITISSAGTYVLSGTLTDGQIIVNSKDNEKVQLVLNGVNITNKTQSPIYIEKAKAYTMITLANGTINSISDSTEYTLPDSQTEELDATIYSKDDLVINGTGTLNINANYNDGIKSNDTLLIASGIINVTSVHDAIYGKDALTVLDGSITIKTGEGAESRELKVETFGAGGRNPMLSENGLTPEDMIIEGVTIPKGSTFEEIHALLEKSGVTFSDKRNNSNKGTMTPPNVNENQPMMPPNMNTQNQSTIPPLNNPNDKNLTTSSTDIITTETTTDLENTDEASLKGLKSKGEVVINGGTITLDTYDDGINANTFIEINGGTINVKSGDDGIKADYLLTINNGDVNVDYSYEGIESKVINFNGGNVIINSVDDGVNASDPDATNEEMPSNPFGSNKELDLKNDPIIYINGSNIYIVATGDAVDSNGGIIMNDGILEVHGVNNGGELAIDFDKSFILNGGNFLVLGGSGNISKSSTQNVISTSLSETALTGTTLLITDSKNNVLFETTLEKDTTAVSFSSNEVTKGETYKIVAGTSTTTITASTVETITSNVQNGMGNMGGGKGQRPTN